MDQTVTPRRPRYDRDTLNHIFTYHQSADVETAGKYAALRAAALAFAQTIVDCTPESADQTDAIRKVREAVMTANAAIALGGRS